MATAIAMIEVYETLMDPGLNGIGAKEADERLARIEELINLPDYYRIESKTTEHDYQEQ